MISTTKSIFNFFGGRRFILTLGCGFVCTLLVVEKAISDVVFQYIILGTVGAYITGNTIESIKGRAEDA